MTIQTYSDIDIDLEAAPIDGSVVEEPEITEELQDPINRTMSSQEAKWAHANAGGAFTSAFLGDPLRFKGRPVTINRYDAATRSQIQRFYGEIVHASLDTGLLRLEASDTRFARLEQRIAQVLVTTTAFPKAQDVGKAIPVVFGNVAKVEAVYVNEDIAGSHFDFLIGHGALSTFADGLGHRVYRSPERTLLTVYPVQVSEYTLSTSLYAGYTSLRFPVAQWDWNNARDKIWVNVAGLQPERNFARAIRTILENAVWGLGEPVNDASFDAAEAALDAVGGLVCDGVITEPTQARDVIRQLGQVRGMILRLNAAGEWTLTVDTQRSGVVATFGDGPGDGVRNLIRCSERSGIHADRETRNVQIKYRRDLIAGQFQHEATRVVHADRGKDLPVECDFIRDHTTADKVAHYLGRRLFYGEETARIVVGQAGRALRAGDLVSLTYAPLGYAADTVELRSVTDRLETIEAVVQGWDASIYGYAAGDLPDDAEGASQTDFSRTAPTAASALSIASSGTEVGADGSTVGFVILQWTTPTTNYAHSIVKHRKTGQTVYASQGPVTAKGVGVQAKVSSLVTNTLYDYAVTTVNPLGIPATSDATISSSLSPKDTSAPATPTGLTASMGTGSAVSLDWADNTESDLGEYHVYRNTTNSPATATLIAHVTASRFVDINVTQGQQYFYWVVAVDRSENQSAKSSSASSTPTSGQQGATPATPSSPSFVSTSTYQAGDGTTLAQITLTLPALPTNAAGMNVLYRINGGTAQWSTANQVYVGSVQQRVDDLTPGQTYQLALQAFNAFGLPSAVSTILTQAAAGDSTVPATPSTPVLLSTTLTSLSIVWSLAATPDLSHFLYDIRTGANGSGSSLFGEIRVDGNTLTINAAGIGYGVTRHVRVKAVDLSGNVGSYSSSLAFSFTQAQTPDLGSGSVTNPIIGSGAVGTGNIQAGAITAQTSASGTSSVSTTSIVTADIPNTTTAIATTAGDLVILTLHLRETRITNTGGSAQFVNAFVEITDGSNNVLADQHYSFLLLSTQFVVVPANLTAFVLPGTGVQTYKARWRVSGSVDANVQLLNANKRILTVVKIQR